MKDATVGDAFARVDHTDDPRVFVHYLDAVAALGDLRSYKERSYGLLHLSSGDRVLDVGCGTGDDARAIAALVGEHGRVIGLDRSAHMVEEARRRTVGSAAVDFVVGDASRLGYADDSFDGVRIDRTLQHVADPGAVVAEMVRVVRSRGRIVASEPDWDTIVVDAADVATTRSILDALSDAHKNPWIGRRLFALLRRHGIVELGVSGFAVSVTDFALADELVGLVPAAAAARERGAISAADEARWLDALRERSAEGAFFAALTIFVVGGTKR